MTRSRRGIRNDGNHHAIRLSVVYEGDDLVHVDRAQLVRVLTNLLTNAREATATGGEIQLRAGVERDEHGDPARLTLSVRDSGPG
jgi:signal transduction histidine kinase